MSKEYLEYWGLNKTLSISHRTTTCSISADSTTNASSASSTPSTPIRAARFSFEEAGLGKTTILLKLVAEMEWNYGENFHCAFIDHPTLTISPLMSQISSSILSSEPHADKFHNLSKIKERLIELKKAGGKAIIVVDEGHTLCGKPKVLQDLRMLLNLTHEKEYLFTMISTRFRFRSGLSRLRVHSGPGFRGRLISFPSGWKRRETW